MLHNGHDFLVGDQDLPDGRHVGFLDSSVHPFDEALDEEAVEVHLDVDVVVAGIQVLSVASTWGNGGRG